MAGRKLAAKPRIKAQGLSPRYEGTYAAVSNGIYYHVTEQLGIIIRNCSISISTAPSQAIESFGVDVNRIKDLSPTPRHWPIHYRDPHPT
jgi:hypothetical protein